MSKINSLSSGKCLLIAVENQTSHHAVCKWIASTINLASYSKVILLWISDRPSIQVENFLSDHYIEVVVVNAFGHLHHEITHSEKSVRQLLLSLFDVLRTNNNWWMTTITEANFSNSQIFTLLRFNLVTKIASEYAVDNALIIGGRSLLRLCRQHFQTIDHPYILHKLVDEESSFPFEGLKTIISWANNLLTEILVLILLRGKSEKIHNKHLVYAQKTRNWRTIDGLRSYRFLGNFPESVKEKTEAAAYLISLARQDKNKLIPFWKALREIKSLQGQAYNLSFHIVESYGNIFEILRCYFSILAPIRWLVYWNRNKASIRWSGIEVSWLFKGALSAINDIPKNSYLRYCIHKALENSSAKDILVPIYELAEGRSVIAGANSMGIKTIGLQHHALTRAHQWRVCMAPGLLEQKYWPAESCTPNQLLLEGQLAKDWLLEAGFPSSKLSIVGSARVPQTIPAFNVDNLSRKILVLGEYHNFDLLLDWCERNISSNNFDVCFRPHPARYEQTQKWIRKKKPIILKKIGLSLPDISLEKDLVRVKPFCILASVTGAVVEIARAGWPIAIIASNWLPNYSPLAISLNEGVQSINTRAEAIQFFQRLLNNQGYINRYSHQCKAMAHTHMKSVGEEATMAIVRNLEAGA